MPDVLLGVLQLGYVANHLFLTGSELLDILPHSLDILPHSGEIARNHLELERLERRQLERRDRGHGRIGCGLCSYCLPRGALNGRWARRLDGDLGAWRQVRGGQR